MRLPSTERGIQHRADHPTAGTGMSAYFWPSKRVCPDVGRWTPNIIRIVVDLPDPFGPRNPVTRPGSTEKLRSVTTCLAP